MGVQPNGKVFWLSKTFWFNVLALVLAVATAFGFGEFEPDAKLLEYASILVMLINLILRFVTKEPVLMSARRPELSRRNHRG